MMHRRRCVRIVLGRPEELQGRLEEATEDRERQRAPLAARHVTSAKRDEESERDSLTSILEAVPSYRGDLVVPELPTDIRHNSKIDRARLADWATRSLAGGRIRKP